MALSTVGKCWCGNTGIIKQNTGWFSRCKIIWFPALKFCRSRCRYKLPNVCQCICNIKIHNDASFKICSPYVSRVLNCDRKASIYNIVVHWCNFCPVTVCQFVRSNVFCRTFRRPIEAREGHHDEDRRYKAGDNFRPTFEHLNFRFHW